MKFNRIIASMLVLVTLITAMLAVMPVAQAAESESAVVTLPTHDYTATGEAEKLEIVAAYKSQKENAYASASDMLDADIASDRVASIVRGNYQIYINVYTGFVYYKNTVTGQVLTSNPIDPGENPNLSAEVLSQVVITYASHAKPKDDKVITSFAGLADGSALVVTKNDSNNTLEVTYSLGESEAVERVPDAIFVSDMEQYIIAPMFAQLETMLKNALGDYVSGSIKTTDSNGNNVYLKSYNPYKTDVSLLKLSGDFHGDMIKTVASALKDYAKSQLGETSAVYKKIADYVNNISVIFTNYSLYNVNINGITDEQKQLWYETVPNMKSKGESVFLLDSKDKDKIAVDYQLIGKALKANLDFSSSLAEEIAAKTGFKSAVDKFARFKCTLVYSLDADGSMNVSLSRNSLQYNYLGKSPESGWKWQDTFIIKSISYLSYFGAGNVNNDGYIFFPDGSGTVIDFADFSNYAVQVKGELYGKDYCYANISGQHREQVTMPVYGVVNDVCLSSASGKTVTNGYLAILEDGAAISTLHATSGGDMHRYATAYASFAPYAFDEYNLGDAISVGGNTSYLDVAKKGFEGSFKTRYVMLSDAEFVSNGSAEFEASYVGMAMCYKNYLSERGVLEKIRDVAEDMPLYIEALGSMNVLQRILTFPVSVSTALTTFKDVQTMYDQLSSKGIDNINFRLTGFANGGMYYTYPARVAWEGSLGGENGFKDLVSYANSVNSNSGKHLGIYPDFDFQYINGTALFDGVSNSWHAAKMVDNRYASKQAYNSVNGLYESLYSILVTSNKLDELYSKFNKDYSKYGLKSLSVSTLGSDLNSNFDDDNTVHRDAARADVVALLNKMANTDKYSLMTDIGNAYTYKFVDHIVNATIDSSHLVHSSYAVPFLGMVLHSYVSYAGTPINYTGSVDYNVLHSIENGAALYYILCMRNANYLKEDEQLSKYYGVDYKNWFKDIVKSYNFLNEAIGDLQSFEIIYHKALIAERVPNSSEHKDDLTLLLSEYVSAADGIIAEAVANTLDAMANDYSYVGRGLSVSVDKLSLLENAKAKFYADELAEIAAIKEAYKDVTDAEELKAKDAAIAKIEDYISSELSEFGFIALLDQLVEKYTVKYPEKNGAVKIAFNKDGAVVTGIDVAPVAFEYDTKHNFSSNSNSDVDEDEYDSSDYTVDNGNVVTVTYKDTSSADGKEVVFLINYNNYDVEVKINGVLYKISRMNYVRIDKEV